MPTPTNPTEVTPSAITSTNIPFAISCAPSANFTAAGKQDVPKTLDDALTFQKSEGPFFLVFNDTGGALILKAYVSGTDAQNAAGLTVSEKEYSIEGRCICLLRAFDAITDNGTVTLYSSAQTTAGNLKVAAFR